MTEKKLQALCKEWQKRLRLQDWGVRVRLSPELSSMARLRTHEQHKCATVYIRPQFSPMEHGCVDLEVSLVHELLHLHTAGYDGPIEAIRAKPDATPDDWARYRAHEAMVELVAQALVSAKRGKQVAPFVAFEKEF